MEKISAEVMLIREVRFETMSFDKKTRFKMYVWRRLLIFALCFGIMFTLYSDMSGGAFAIDQERNVGLSEHEAAWRDTQGGELLYGSFAEALEKVSSGGTVILRSDVSLTAGITVSKPITITSWDADAPCTIKNTTTDSDDKKELGRIFTVSGCQLIMRDIILDGGKDGGVAAYHPLICVTNGAVLRMLEGTVLRNAENISQSFCGGGVNIRYGQLYMYDGSVITGCKSRHGGGVEVNSKNKAPAGAVFGMAGGSIESCSADSGGGVYVNIGQFQMLGGKITGNSAVSSAYNAGGGGIYVAGERYTAAVRIADGIISGNTALSTGGGILVKGGYTLLQIDGGTLENNHANTGGGVSMILGTMRLFGGTVTDNTAELYGGGVLGSPDSVILLQGAPEVFGNTAKDKADIFDNLYLDGADDDGYPTSPIRLVGPLTDGVRLGMSRWVCPDEGGHPYRQMIVPYNGYTISQGDIDRLCCDRTAENKELFADNMEKYAFIPYNGEIVMVLAVDVQLDKESLSFKGLNDPPESVIATVMPANAPERGVTWSSSDENVAAVDENGKVTPVGSGKAVITATTRSPYHASASCVVTVGYQLTTEAEHGTNTFTPGDSDGYFLSGEQITLNVTADEEYRLHSLKAYRTDDISAEVVINDDNTLTMPDHDVTVEAVFEPVPYAIGYELDGGALKDGETNPEFYTIESGGITLNNPSRSGFTFAGWTGTGLTEPTLVVKIPAGSIGERKYTALWEEENSSAPAESESEPSSGESEPTSSDSKPTDNSTPSESGTPSDSNSEPSSGETPSESGESEPTSSDSEPTDSGDAPSESGTPSDSDSEPPNENTHSTGDDNNSAASGSAPTDIDDNPSTGMAISLIPLSAVVIAVMLAAAKQKRKNL